MWAKTFNKVLYYSFSVIWTYVYKLFYRYMISHLSVCILVCWTNGSSFCLCSYICLCPNSFGKSIDFKNRCNYFPITLFLGLGMLLWEVVCYLDTMMYPVISKREDLCNYVAVLIDWKMIWWMREGLGCPEVDVF